MSSFSVDENDVAQDNIILVPNSHLNIDEDYEEESYLRRVEHPKSMKVYIMRHKW